MLSAARNLHRFRGDSQLSTWLGRIVINSALSRRHAIRRRSEEPHEMVKDAREGRAKSRPALPTAGPCPERTLWRSEIRALVRAAVDELPEDYRTVVVQRHLEDADIEEIASRLRISPNAVKIRLHRARRRLHATLARRGYPATIRG